MEAEKIHQLMEIFESSKHISPEGVEFWFARDLQGLLGYNQWRNFLEVIEKAKIS